MYYVYAISYKSKIKEKYYSQLSETMLFNNWHIGKDEGYRYMFSGKYNSNINEAMHNAVDRILLLLDIYPEMKEIVLTGYEIHDYHLEEIDEVKIVDVIKPLNMKLKAWRI